MISKVYSVFDSKLATFGRPWYELTDASAIRVFSDAVNDGSNPNNQWFKHPEDFSLYMVGEFDDEFGHLVPKIPVALVTASAIFRPVYEDSAQLDFFDKNGTKKKEPAIK